MAVEDEHAADHQEAVIIFRASWRTYQKVPSSLRGPDSSDTPPDDAMIPPAIPRVSGVAVAARRHCESNISTPHAMTLACGLVNAYPPCRGASDTEPSSAAGDWSITNKHHARSQLLDNNHLRHRELYSAVAKDMAGRWTSEAFGLLDLGCGGAGPADMYEDWRSHRHNFTVLRLLTTVFSHCQPFARTGGTTRAPSSEP
jgi:hypothetical protein